MAVRYDLEHGRTRNKLIGLLADGLTYQSAADAIASPSLKTSPPAVFKFAQRHAAEIAKRREMLAETADSSWIGDKTERVRKLAGLYQALTAELEAHGPRVKEVKEIAEDGTVTTTRYGGGWITQQLRGILRDAAEELGQIERPSINQNIQVNQFLVREYGVDAPSDT